VTIDLSVVIVTYRCRDAARECLRSLEQHRSDAEFEVIVLDNASGDGTVEMIRAEFADVRLLALDENLGFAAGVNRAAEKAHGEYVLLLNPDTVVHDGALDNLVRFARAHPEHGLVGGRTLDPDGRVNPGSCWAQPSLWSLACFATMLSTAFRGSRLFDPEAIGGWQRDTVREVGIVTGCLLLVPRDLWRELGGFDTRFFMYGEDADLAMRAWARGLRPAITPDAVVTHEIGVSSSSRPDKLVLLFRGKATLLRKHWSPARRELGLVLLRVGVGVRALLARGRKDRAAAWPAVWAARKSWVEGYADAGPDGASSVEREPAAVR
jgi:N-acetylglucosaminyl-diphospho-decaprenol L-rhamnosyltransferase